MEKATDKAEIEIWSKKSQNQVTDSASNMAKLLCKKHYSYCNELKKHFPGSVLVLNLLAQAIKACFARTEGKKLVRPA